MCWPSISRKAIISLLMLACLMVLPHRAQAVEPGEALSDPRLEQRARKLSAELRCLVCQNQSIDDSNAPLAKDLRLLVRERLSKGETDEQVLGFIVDRYGEFVLLRPPFGMHTLLLWLAPLLALLATIYGFGRYIRMQRQAVRTEPARPLDGEEERRLAELLEAHPKDPKAS